MSACLSMRIGRMGFAVYQTNGFHIRSLVTHPVPRDTLTHAQSTSTTRSCVGTCLKMYMLCGSTGCCQPSTRVRAAT